ncbi:MAG: hypothetical protein ABJ242_09965 [Marinomonas sp.]
MLILDVVLADPARSAELISLNDRFESAANALAYVSPCKNFKYPVDIDKIRRDVRELQKDAVQQGMSEQEAGDRLRSLVQRKFVKLNEAITLASVMSIKSQNRHRFERKMARECAKIAPRSDKTD